MLKEETGNMSNKKGLCHTMAHTLLPSAYATQWLTHFYRVPGLFRQHRQGRSKRLKWFFTLIKGTRYQCFGSKTILFRIPSIDLNGRFETEKIQF